ncbi:MAG TPA: hypothetical protein VES00_12720 [Burkholderiaceae bacterium]|jgi:hypothetical protein|nr:hypothetical protein [Burkholderiaceae bacterium]
MSDTDPRIFPVTVNVSTDASGNVNISCDPETIDVPKGLGCALITFTLKGPAGFSFSPTDAIVPEDKSNSDFPCASWTISDTLAGLYDRNKHAAKVKYTVNVVDAEGNKYPYDPDIQNGGSVSTCDDDC